MNARVVVVGGGYAGCMAANRLAGRDDVDVTLINDADVFVERIRLHQLAAGTGTAALGFERVLNPAVDLQIGAVTRLDSVGRQVILADGRRIGYDYAIYALGSGQRVDVPATDDAEVFQIAVADDAARLAARLDVGAPTVAVIGGGLTGVEVAAEIAEGHPDRDVTLICAGPLVPSAGDRGRRSVARHLRALRVSVLDHTRVTEVCSGKISFDDGQVHPADIIVWATGFAFPSPAAASGLEVGDDGRLLVDETLVSSDGRIIGAGDAVAVRSVPLRMSCQAAMPLGAQAAATVSALIDGRVPSPVDQGFAAQCISIGRRRATVVRTDRSDVAVGLYAGGRIAAPAKELVCRMTIRWLAGEARKPGSYSWPGRG